MTVGGRALLVRTDASPAIGMGHAMRCLSLAAAYAEVGGRTTFVMSSPPASFTKLAAHRGIEVLPLAPAPGTPDDLQETTAASRALDAAWIVLDGYRFDGAFQAGLTDAGTRVLALDDHGHGGSYHAQLVLNQNVGADEAMYADRGPATRLLLGPRFALLRDEFRRWPADRSAVPAVGRRVVVTFGGSDPENVSARALEGLAGVREQLEIMVLVGPANPHRASLERAAASCAHPVEVVVDPSDMAARLAGSDLAVAAAGVTALELARVGTPQIAIVVADNQRPGAAALEHGGTVVNLGWHGEVEPEMIGNAVAELAHDGPRRAEMSRRGRELVDGRGVRRVLGAMQLLNGSEAAA